MTVFGRQERQLLIGLVIAVIAWPVQQFLDIAHDLDHVLGMSLLPAFVALTVAVILHRQARSCEAKSAGQTAEARAHQSPATTGQIERLATHRQLLARAAASFGVTVPLPGEVDSHAIIARAEPALNRAKGQGTNSVRLVAEPIVA